MQHIGTAKAEDWYAVQSFDAGVTLISERFIDPFYRCNIWHVRGRDHDLLIDSGMGVVSLKASIPWLAERPVTAVASHCHFDHIGNHHEFDQRVCHCAEAHVLAQPDPRETLADRFAVVEMFSALPPGGYAQQAYRVQPAPATRVVEHGDVIDLGDRQFQVLHVPGHSPGSIALWEAQTGVLFSGDCVYDGPLIDDAFRSSVDDYCESMERLRELPVRVVHGGHFPSFGAQRFSELIDDYQAGKRLQGCPR
ncbi:MBL fold metallo-hydrolase [Burkholderia sp. Ac-20365]|uniref:MBL fold metallo-hydrolase n=1 Tax=Burkholderia sp. Ac-20365 TaxID=2703897 RepID=UPI00197C0204|nr:MBL fold metallo-hydrolase [Burkholderia sp. Ac-20365]MBN3761775.1 MBL fold metallo-hydrolase [Burkholderia sp. Ac-20365]